MLVEKKPEFLRTVKSDEFVPTVSPWVSFGGLILIGSCGVAILLASIIKYPIAVRAAASVRPAGELRIVEAATSGVVNTILVKENQIVDKGQEIATIDSSQLRTRKNSIKLNIRQNHLKLAQINAQMKALQTQIKAESNAMQRAIAAAEAEFSRSQREYRDKQLIAEAEVQEALASLELAKEEMKRYQQLGKTGAISLLQIRGKEQSFKASQAKLQRVKAALNPSISTVAIAQENIAQQRARGESTLAGLNKEKESLLQRRIEIENQISREYQELQQILKDLEKTIIRSTERGTILKLELRNSGQVVRPGQAITQIAPSNTPLAIKARVAADDISKVLLCKASQVADCKQGNVQMRVSTYPYPDYGTLKGAVRAITADTITPQRNSNISVPPFYEVTIEPEKLYLEKGNQQYPIQPGMEVTADIIFQQETVLTFILRKARLLAGF
ncbi:HlyD family efflux transporter periplasmic adaptor subunit [Scytonema sp. UIC 10036]|uniref:HlyD family efflux transporter periplasmic adaptor subunit n=1 Tax=Scytonema sp. UIC 10036 TaxID=2304196 RepID=UPI0012DAB4A9|nr:HlyD family efflux transporter periplasmic adaptor subunit [Scytonema sp. UIC 10036]MUH00737.1 HlyD family efflux transporter periplasmic adaptor subunit [Scytonema sp. UIC 10036]